MFGIVEFQDEEENEPLRYTPMYTFYNWEQLTPTMFLSQTSLNHTEEHHDVNDDTNTLQVIFYTCCTLAHVQKSIPNALSSDHTSNSYSVLV